MDRTHDVYLFGQILGTHSFLLKNGFLQPDEYSEIAEQYFLPGGETGRSAKPDSGTRLADSFIRGRHTLKDVERYARTTF